MSVRDKAAEARFAYEAHVLKGLQEDIDKRLKALDERVSELKVWMTRRDEFVTLATDQLVAIYGSMNKDAAAQQLGRISVETAAAIISKLESRVASAVLGEMDVERAAQLAGIIAGAARTDPPGPRS